MATRNLLHVACASLALALGGCHAATPSAPPVEGDPAPGDPRPGDANGGEPTPADACGGDAVPSIEAAACVTGESYCQDHATSRVCVDVCATHGWLTVTCPALSGCYQGACAPSTCADECVAGAVDGAKTCQLVDAATGSSVDMNPATSLHDRARAYETWIWRDSIKYGGITNPRYDDAPTYSHQVPSNDIRDSAIWTGTYLAAEALRLKATGAADARAHVKELVATLHFWFSVTGAPGDLARFVAPAGNHPLTTFYCTSPEYQCGKSYGGQLWDYMSHISRDQYQGPFLGYAIAYEALGSRDEATRALIRADVLGVTTTLMTEQTFPVQVVYNGTPLPRTNVTTRYVILNPEDMTNNAVQITVDSVNLDNSDWFGMREFFPDLSDFLHELPGLSWTPSLPRASSSIMVASFFQVGLLVTAGVPGLETQHQALQTFYDANIGSWLSMANTWTGTKSCDDPYFGNNIMMEPMYNLARLESDPVRHDQIATTLLNGRMAPFFAPDKNVFFAYIAAANATSVDPAIVSTNAAQLSQFPPPPRVRVPRNWGGDPRYPPNQDCTYETDFDHAIDVGDRQVDDFIWQRDPRSLYDSGDLTLTYPGVDYLVAYWLGRAHGFLPEDSAASCLAWR